MVDYNERRPIKGYPNYEVDCVGNVYSLDHYTIVPQQNYRKMPFKGRQLKLALDRDGYYSVEIIDENGKSHTRLVHRLVAEAFIPNPDGLPSVNHKDEIKTNNHIDNLEWCTWQYNASYGTANERRRKKLLGRTGIANSRPVMGKRIEDTEWTYYPSNLSAAKALGIKCSSNVGSVCMGIYKQVNGYVFRYAEQGEEDNG